MRLALVSCLAAVLAGVSASVNFPLAVQGAGSVDAAAAKPTPPSEDPFYKAPKGFKDAKPGDVLRQRPVPGRLAVGPALQTNNYEKAYQVMYRTTDGVGNPAVAVNTVIVPKKANKKQLMVYNAFYDTADNDCSPSYTLQAATNSFNIEGVIISIALRQGWIVAVPDYEGIHALFTIGRQAGHATLDAVKATLRSRKASGLVNDPRIGMFGYSGGALATEWALELAPKYAPNLKIDGAAYGGLTPNVTNVIISTNDTPNSNLIPTGIWGFAGQYPAIRKYLKTAIKPAKYKLFSLPLRSCDTGKLSNKDIVGFFKNGLAGLNKPSIKAATQQNGIMGLTNTPTIPSYIFKTVGDEVSPVADTDALVQKYCEAGASIRYARNAFGTHSTEALVAIPQAFGWLKKRLNGDRADKGCSTRNLNKTDLHPGDKFILGNTVYQEFKAQLGSM